MATIIATSTGGGLHDGTSEANAYTYEEAIEALSGGDKLYIKGDGDHLVTSTATMSSNGSYAQIEGYLTTPGDRAGKPNIVAGADGITLLNASTYSGIFGSNLKFLSGGHTECTAVNSRSLGVNNAFLLDDIECHGAFDVGFDLGYRPDTCRRLLANGCVVGFWCQGSILVQSTAIDCTTKGFNPGGGGVTYTSCVSINSGDAGHTAYRNAYIGTIVIGGSLYAGTGGSYRPTLASECLTWGGSISLADKIGVSDINCFGPARSALTEGSSVNYTTLTSDPFVDSSTGDLRLSTYGLTVSGLMRHMQSFANVPGITVDDMPTGGGGGVTGFTGVVTESRSVGT